jgi:hypothetical protein
MKLGGFFKIVIALAIVWVILCSIRPFWSRYWLEQDVKEAALYATKHTVTDTKAYLTKLMKDNGRSFVGTDFAIQKSPDKTVTIGITYEDSIRVFGLTLKELEFTVESTQRDVKGFF